MTTGDFLHPEAVDFQAIAEEAQWLENCSSSTRMDWKLLATPFGIVFVAELGDKTQLAALALTGKSGRPLSVFLGASAALVLVTLLGVAVGAVLKKAFPEKAMNLVSAILFLAVGAFLLFRALTAGHEPTAGG